MQKVADHIIAWLAEYVEKSHTKGFVVGVSGGIDSGVVSSLCARTGKDVILVEMPIHQAEDQVSRGKDHMTDLANQFDNVSIMKVDLTASYDLMISGLEASRVIQPDSNTETRNLTLGNTRSRLRMSTLYAIAGMNGLLVCGTGNKVEDFGVGFFTKYGDGGVDLSPIADLMKSEVYALGAYLGVNQAILTAKPTDGLWDDGRTDEDQMGATYDELEWAMNLQARTNGSPDLNTLNEREQAVWQIYSSRHRANLHKMNPIPVCEIPEILKT